MTASARTSSSRSRLVILGTGVVLGVGSIVLIFAPVEIARALGVTGAEGVALLLQLYGAALFGLAMTGWMVKDAIIGGIFGRSYVVGNSAHAFVGAFALIRPAVAAGATPALWLLTGVYCVLAILFGYLMFVAAP